MTWFLVWVLLVAGAVLVLALLGRRLWRQVKELTRELNAATDRLTAIADRLGEIDNDRNPRAPDLDGVPSQGPRRRP
jgi:hypothetical protein